MAGHSHWAKIKRAKGSNDAKRGKIWSKIARKIIIAAKNGGDPRDNLNLRYTIDEARAANMPRDTIEKAIKKGTGELGGENYESATYEAYAPGGIALLIDASSSMMLPFPSSQLRGASSNKAAFLTTVAAGEAFVRHRASSKYQDLIALVEFGALEIDVAVGTGISRGAGSEKVGSGDSPPHHLEHRGKPFLSQHYSLSPIFSDILRG